MNLRPHGIIPALATPMDEDESIDEDGLRKLVAHVIERGVHGIFAAGTQGEFYGLSTQEKRRVFQIVVEEAAGRVPVYAGTGAPTTRETIALTTMAGELGVSAASVLTPYFIRPGIASRGHWTSCATISKGIGNRRLTTNFDRGAPTVKQCARGAAGRDTGPKMVLWGIYPNHDT